MAAGSVAALAWGALEPLDKRMFRHDYSDVAVLGKAFTRGPGWVPTGLAWHAMNGAIFGLAYDRVRRELRVGGTGLAVGMALVEHVTLYPLGYVVDRYHPAQGEPGVSGLIGRRPLAQGLIRHTVFGVILGRLA